MKFNKIEYLVFLINVVSTWSEPRSFLLCSASALHSQRRCIEVSVLSLQNLHIGSFLTPISHRYLLSRQCPVRVPSNNLKSFLGRLSNSVDFFSLTDKKAFDVLMPSFAVKCCLCLSRSHWLTSCFQSLSINAAPCGWSDGIAADLANWSAISLPTIPECPGIQTSFTLFAVASWLSAWIHSNAVLLLTLHTLFNLYFIVLEFCHNFFQNKSKILKLKVK